MDSVESLSRVTNVDSRSADEFRARRYGTTSFHTQTTNGASYQRYGVLPLRNLVWIYVTATEGRRFGSIRRECVDHLIVLDAAHLRRILQYCHGR
jgi:hypothetical protein